MKKLSGTSGFTIVEIIVAIAVGSILFGSGISILTSQETLSQRNKNMVITNAFAEAKVEALRNEGYLALGAGIQDISSELPATLPSPKSAIMTVSDSIVGEKRITITITYNNAGKTQESEYATIIGELGAGQY